MLSDEPTFLDKFSLSDLKLSVPSNPCCTSRCVYCCETSAAAKSGCSTAEIRSWKPVVAPIVTKQVLRRLEEDCAAAIGFKPNDTWYNGDSVAIKQMAKASTFYSSVSQNGKAPGSAESQMPQCRQSFLPRPIDTSNFNTQMATPALNVCRQALRRSHRTQWLSYRQRQNCSQTLARTFCSTSTLREEKGNDTKGDSAAAQVDETEQDNSPYFNDDFYKSLYSGAKDSYLKSEPSERRKLEELYESMQEELGPSSTAGRDMDALVEREVYAARDEVSKDVLEKPDRTRKPSYDFSGMNDPDRDIAPDEVFRDDDITSLAHAQLDVHREMREYSRLAAWEMPLLSSTFTSMYCSSQANISQPLPYPFPNPHQRLLPSAGDTPPTSALPIRPPTRSSSASAPPTSHCPPSSRPSSSSSPARATTRTSARSR